MPVYRISSLGQVGKVMKTQNNSNKGYFLEKLYQDKSTSYKVIVSIVFGLMGFALNFFPVEFVFYGSYRMSFLFGLIFPMLITLSWGWKYGLLSALCGGCQTMWFLWVPQSGYGTLASVTPFTLWIVWLGWFSRTRRNIYLGEVIFRVFNTLILYMVFRWAFKFNSPPANLVMPLTVVNSIVFKEMVNGFLILSLARGLLYSKTIREFFGLRETRTDPRVYYVFLNILILASMLTLILLGERFLWNNWSAEFRNPARLLGSLLLLIAGAFCLYGAAGEFVRRKIERVVERERKQREFNQRYLDTIFRTSQDGIFTLDSDGNFELSNEATFRTFGWPREELIGSHFMKVMPPDVHEFMYEKWAEVQRGEGTSYEVDILTKDGDRRSMMISYKDMDIGGKRKYCVLIKDITELKLTERELTKHRNQLEEIVRERTGELRENQKRLEQIVQGCSIPIIVIDRDHTVTHWNRACESLTKISADEIIGTSKQWSAFYTEERPTLADIVIEDSPEPGISRYYGDRCRKSVLIDNAYEAENFFPELGENGKWFNFSAAVLYDSQGNIAGAIETFQDITWRKQAEEDLIRARDELEIRVEERTADLHASNKELEAFSYSVSHDLRAPLRSVDGFSKLLLEECSDNLNEQGIHYLGRVRAGAQNMGALIDDMLTLSRLGCESMKIKTIDMTAIAEEAKELLRDEWKDRKVDFTFHDCPEVSADHDLLRIVLVNLLSNALKFSRNIDTAIIEFGHRIADDQSFFFLKDNGIGFNMTYAKKIFAPFQRLHRSEEYEGSGIGLASVQRIIDRHGGRIWIESDTDSGTTVFFTVAGK